MPKSTLSPSRPRGRPVNAATRDAIVVAATKLFMAHGLHATTMEAIARSLSISKLTLYSRFPSKDMLFAEVIEAKCQHHFPEFLFQGLSDRSVEEVLYSVAHGLMQLLLSDDVIAMERMLMAEAATQPPLIQLFYDSGPRRMKKIIVEQMTYWHRSRQLNVPDAALATDMFCALIKGSDMVFRRSMGLGHAPGPKKIATYCRSVVDHFMAAHQTSV